MPRISQLKRFRRLNLKAPTMTLLHQAHLLDKFYLGCDSIGAADGTLRHFEVYTLTSPDGRTDYRWAAEGEAFSNGGYTSAREAHLAACLVLTGQNECALTGEGA